MVLFLVLLTDSRTEAITHMIDIYFTVFLVIFIFGACGSVVVMFGNLIENNSIHKVLRYSSVTLVGSILFGLLWPIAVIAIIPSVLFFGTFSIARAIKHRTLFY